MDSGGSTHSALMLETSVGFRSTIESLVSDGGSMNGWALMDSGLGSDSLVIGGLLELRDVHLETVDLAVLHHHFLGMGAVAAAVGVGPLPGPGLGPALKDALLECCALFDPDD